MFVFAQYVSATRKVLRSGVLCWIRDPNDPNFHPIKEILDKKSWTQLKKIAASAVMYAAILVASVGVNTYFLRYVLGGVTGVLPLRWKPFDPWTEVPVDLLLIHFALPWATSMVDPEKISQRWLKAWWRTASRALRLSSYMIGGKEFEEERSRVKGQHALIAAWNALFFSSLPKQSQQAAAEEEGYEPDGQMCRVPDDDKAITSGPLIIPLNEQGEPATERLAEAVVNQEKDALKHTPKPTYTNIYLPSNYAFASLPSSRCFGSLTVHSSAPPWRFPSCSDDLFSDLPCSQVAERFTMFIRTLWDSAPSLWGGRCTKEVRRFGHDAFVGRNLWERLLRST